MKNPKVQISVFVLAVLLSTAVLPSSTQASFLDVIRALVAINPLEVEVSAPSLVETNRVFRVEALVTNKGEERISQTTAEIFLPEGVVLARRNATQNAGAISGGRTKTIRWSVKAEQAGNYGISVSVSGQVRGSSVSADGNTVIVTVQDDLASFTQSENLIEGIFNALGRWLGL